MQGKTQGIPDAERTPPKVLVWYDGANINQGGSIDILPTHIGDTVVIEITIENGGQRAIVITKIEVSGSSEFSLNLDGFSSDVHAERPDTFKVLFIPTSIGEKQVALKIHSDDPVNPTYVIWLKSNVLNILSACEKLQDWVVFPNPFSDIISISNSENIGSFDIKIMDLSGKMLKQVSLLNSEWIDVSSLSKGKYVIQINSSYQEIISTVVKN